MKTTSSRTIVVEWAPAPNPLRGAPPCKRMRVIASGHPRYAAGNRFDFEIMRAVTLEEGYTVVLLPEHVQTGI